MKQININEIFTEDSNYGKVKVENDQIIKDNGQHIDVINLNDLQFVYLNVYDDTFPYFFFFDHHQNSIPSNYKGFRKVYNELSNRFNFNDEEIFKLTNKKSKLKKELWRKKHDQNFEILEGSFDDYDQGFEIQSEPKNFISWDTTSNELEKNPNIFFEKSPYDQNLLKFKPPIRFGNILFHDFSAYFDNHRNDAPVLRFFQNCFSKSGTIESYHQLKKALTNHINSHDGTCGSNFLRFDFNGMELRMSYSIDSDSDYDRGYTSLSITNERDYTQLLVDNDYEAKIVISDFLKLEGAVGMSNSYKTNKRIKRRPEKINQQFDDTAIIWMDNENNKIGFSNSDFSQVFDKSEFYSFEIENIYPAKGPKTANLVIKNKDQKRIFTIFKGDYHFFDEYAEKIETLTDKKVTFAPEY